MVKANKKNRRASQRQGKKSANLRYGVPSKAIKGGIYPNGGNKGFEQVCALTNPFCPAARGAKIPDDDSAPSIPATFVSTFEVMSNGAGDAGFEIDPSMSEVFRTASTISGTDISAWNSFAAIKDYTAAAASFDQVRIVSMGVRIYSVAKPTEQQGYIRVVTLPERPGTALNVDGGLWDAVETYPISELDCHVVMKPQGNEWKTYHPVSSQNLDYNKVIAIAKAIQPSTLAFIVEITMNCECVTQYGSITGGLATGAATSNPHALSAASATHSRHKGIHNGSTTSVMSKLGGFAKSALLDVAASAIPFIGNSVANMFRPKQSRYPMIVD
jgi:hypothetical protein